MVFKKTILILPYTHTFSHLSRPLLVARELRERGFTIIFGGESEKVSLIRAENFPVEELWEPDPEILFGNIRQGKLRFVEARELQKMIAADRLLIQRVKPDLVLTDGRFSAMISCQMEEARHAAIVNTSSTEFRACPYMPISSKYPFGKKFFDRINLWLEMKTFDAIMGTFKHISKKFRLRKTVTATNCLTGVDLTLMADIPSYFPSRNLPPDYRYIGPLTWESVEIPKPPDWWDEFSDKGPLIYITMGTTGVKHFFPCVRNQFLKSSLLAVMTTGGQVEPLESVPGKFRVESFLDGDMVMEACDLVVCHGGNGTIYQAFKHGKPVIGIPTLPDQKFNMRRVVAIGAGIELPLKTFLSEPATLVQATRRTIENESYLENAAKMKQFLSAYDARNLAATAIEELLRDRI